MLQKLYDEAEEQHIVFFNLPLVNTIAFCFCVKNGFCVIMDNRQIHSVKEEQKIVAHELAHCEHGYVYKLADSSNPLYQSNLKKYESLACRAALKKLVPLDILTAELKKKTELEDIADKLNVENQDVIQAIMIYRIEHQLDPLYFDE